MIHTINRKELKKLINKLYSASKPMGMGFFHYVPGSMPEQYIEEYVEELEKDKTLRFDYVSGRMVKTNIELKESLEVDGDKLYSVEVLPETPREDYQSWGGTYKTAEDIFKEIKAEA